MASLDILINPAVLFFTLGFIATLVKSDLSIPEPIAKYLSIFLLIAIGFHGGVELRENGLGESGLLILMSAALFSALAPFWIFKLIKQKLNAADAAALAASYGSVSAVTFITAIGYLKSAGIEYDGYMVAALALMEFPAIAAGVLLYHWHYKAGEDDNFSTKALLHETFFSGAVFLLVGSFIIGWSTGEQGWLSMKPFFHEPMKGMLCLFLLDMGIIAARRFGELKGDIKFIVSFALLAAIPHGLLGVGIAYAIGATPGNALLLAVLFGSASYIAVPAAMRMAIPSANSGLYLTASLAITFPFNLTLGIPGYLMLVNYLWG